MNEMVHSNDDHALLESGLVQLPQLKAEGAFQERKELNKTRRWGMDG